jgi:uncharacterized protein (UPF0212 family)
MADYTITVSGVDQAKLEEAIDIAIGSVRGALEKAGLTDVQVSAVPADAGAEEGPEPQV